MCQLTERPSVTEITPAVIRNDLVEILSTIFPERDNVRVIRAAIQISRPEDGAR